MVNKNNITKHIIDVELQEFKELLDDTVIYLNIHH